MLGVSPRNACARRIAHRIRFGLDDAPAQASVRQIVDQRLADQVLRELDRVDGQFRAPQSAGSASERLCRDFRAFASVGRISGDP